MAYIARTTSIRSGLIGSAALLASSLAFGQASLDNPAPNSTESGVGVISGWHCMAEEIRIEIDGIDQGLAGTGTSRLDTQSVCGRADTGFSLLVNYNVLSPGQHTIRVFADGSLLTQRQFISERSAGQEFAVGLNRSELLANFPEPGTRTLISWSQSKQGYVVKDLTRWGQESGRITELLGNVSFRYMFNNDRDLYGGDILFSASDRDGATGLVKQIPQALLACEEFNELGYEFLCIIGLEDNDIDALRFNVSADGSLAGDYTYCPDGISDFNACVNSLFGPPDGVVSGFVDRSAATPAADQAEQAFFGKSLARNIEQDTGAGSLTTDARSPEFTSANALPNAAAYADLYRARLQKMAQRMNGSSAFK